MPQVSDYTALLSGDSWHGADSYAAPAFVTFSFESRVQASLPKDVFNNAALNSMRKLSFVEQQDARDALRDWADASGLVFLEVKAGQGDIRFGVYDFDLDSTWSATAGFAYIPTQQVKADYSYRSDIGGDVFLDDDYAGDAHVLRHEIGHAIGFKHPFEGKNTLPKNLDNTDHTVMSYTGSRPGVLADLDLDAVVAVYGGPGADGRDLASWSWKSKGQVLKQIGDDKGHEIFGVSVRDVIDGRGGNDLICGFEGNDTLTGGDGKDKIYGGLGNDKLKGGNGKDILVGEEGNDSFIFNAVKTGEDLIRWYSNDAGDNDVLRFSARAFGDLGRASDGTGYIESQYFQSSFAAEAQTADARFLYERDTGILRFDPDGTGAADASIIARFNNFVSLELQDILIY